MTNSQRIAASFRDPSGFLFQQNGILYRQINHFGQENYQHFLDSGLYQELVDLGLLIRHQDANVQPPLPALAYKVIQPQRVSFISYPYEWSFGQLKDAALTTLTIQKCALRFGMSLKDCSAYNIQFHGGRPTLIDSLSFEVYKDGEPWTAYRQFCQHFLAPLALMAYQDVRLSQLLRIYIDGLPLDLASRLLPFRTRLVPALFFHIHLHAASQRRYANKTVDKAAITQRMSKTSFLGLIDSLESGARGLRWTPAGTEWADYYAAHNYTPAGVEHKQQLVGEFLDRIKPLSVWDLGANTGLFSRLASQRGISTLAFDVDPGAVEQNYQSCIAEKETNLLPLLMDLTNPSPSLGWHNRERMSLLERGPAEAVLALALIHHLAIANNVPLAQLAEFFSQLCRWLIIEFIPKSDSQVQRLLATRNDIFSDYNEEGFEQAFSEHFAIRAVERICDSTRSLYLLERTE